MRGAAGAREPMPDQNFGVHEDPEKLLIMEKEWSKNILRNLLQVRTPGYAKKM